MVEYVSNKEIAQRKTHPFEPFSLPLYLRICHVRKNEFNPQSF